MLEKQRAGTIKIHSGYVTTAISMYTVLQYGTLPESVEMLHNLPREQARNAQ